LKSKKTDMATNLKKTDISASPSADSVDATSEASASLTPELVIALCGPIGSPLHEAAVQIANTLRDFNYRTETIRLSNYIRLNAEKTNSPVDNSSKFGEIQSLISIGNELRETYGNAVLAKLAIAKIGADRKKHFGKFEDVAAESNQPEENKICSQRICHVIDSIKNTAELDLLRLIYGNALFAVGIFSPLEIRKANLEYFGKSTSKEIEGLIDKDSGEEFGHGQSVRDTFPRCDFFLCVDHAIGGPMEARAIAQVTEKVRRFFDLIFRTKVITPTTEETAMYAASSAARNSACLSRQVGAAVTSSTGELLAVGWNDVPQSGGGLYGKEPMSSIGIPPGSSVEKKDHRCFAWEGRMCHNDAEKRLIAEKVVESLINRGVVQEISKEKATQAIIEDTRVKDLIEFSRAVHAEMHAILGASRVAGDRVLGGKIYVTTYPCHSCARHLIAAGISEIHYIEPYRKSQAIRLHSDAITESAEASKVQLLQFDGVSPRRFIDLFEGGSRKRGGVLTLAARGDALPWTHVSLKAIPRLEEVVVAEISVKALLFSSLLSTKDTNEA
jgi:deoxycytidylate deaminase